MERHEDGGPQRHLSGELGRGVARVPLQPQMVPHRGVLRRNLHTNSGIYSPFLFYVQLTSLLYFVTVS